MSIIDASNHKSAIKVASASKMVSGKLVSTCTNYSGDSSVLLLSNLKRYQDKDEVIKALKEELKTLNKGLEESRKGESSI